MNEWETTTSDAGVYVRLFELASGGMGRVDVALRSQGSFRRLYAIKRLHPHTRNDEAFRSMFLDEARIAGLLRHPNVVSVLDLGEDDGGPFLVMDYVDGVSAANLLRRIRKSGELLPVQLATSIVSQAAAGLHAAHELTDHDGRALSLVHRDVSPSNILIGFDGVVRVSDFGIAKALGRRTRTDSGVLKGKLGYMSPEQLRFREPDRRSDIFALGVVLFEMVAGRRLYSSSKDGSAPLRILEEPVPDLGDERPDLPPKLVDLCFRMLAKDRVHRPETARDVAAELDAVTSELVAAEGRLEIGDFVSNRFVSEREARGEILNERLEHLEPMPTLAASSPEERPSRPRRWALTGVAIAAIALAVLGVIASTLETADDTADERPSNLSGAPPSEVVSTAPREEPAIPSLEESPPETAAHPEQTREDMSEDRASAAPVEPTADDSRPSRRRRRRSQMSRERPRMERIIWETWMSSE
jgi:serine/threonine-protein kinase